MAAFLGTQMAKLAAVPPRKISVADAGGRARVFNETVPLTAQASGDTIDVAVLPQGARVLYGVLVSSVSLGTATVAVGTASAPAKYRAATTVTAADTPILFGVSGGVGTALPEPETVRLTLGVAALPASGTLRVMMVYAVD
ncbi:MAG: hypothetical protein ACTS3R_07800 [Inquilinaceae bacterium]